MADRLTLSSAQARRVALAAQGFADRRPAGRIDRRHLRRVLERVGLIQIDSVNVLVRSQELPLFARLGPHPRSLIPAAAADGELFEYSVHEASHIPSADRHLYRWIMDKDHRWQRVRDLRHRRPGFIDEVHEFVRANGPIVAGELQQRDGPKHSWWDWDDGKVALEHLFHTGKVTARRRPNDFARMYDLTERMLPPAVLSRPALPERDARKALLLRAARHVGIATLEDLTDYHRQKTAPCRPLVAELVEDGQLIEVQVEGWTKPAYMHVDAHLPRWVRARAMLSPFDSLVWSRPRTERLFGFHYRIEIYVPQPKRRFGYYVLPFLLGDRLVARVDLKADRANRTLLVQSAWGEPGIHEPEVAAELMEELELLAGWLGLERVQIVGRGDLSRWLAPRSVRASAPDPG